MNTVTCTVTKVLSEPFINYGKWRVRVEFENLNVHGGTTEIILPDNKAAMAVNVGYKFDQ